MKKQESIRLRLRVKELALKGMKKIKIAEMLGVSRKFVRKWINTQDIKDKRGWVKGRKRKYTDRQEKTIIEKRQELSDNFFLEQGLLNKK